MCLIFEHGYTSQNVICDFTSMVFAYEWCSSNKTTKSVETSNRFSHWSYKNEFWVKMKLPTWNWNMNWILSVFFVQMGVNIPLWYNILSFELNFEENFEGNLSELEIKFKTTSFGKFELILIWFTWLFSVPEILQEESMHELSLLQPPSTIPTGRERTISNTSRVSTRSARKVREVFRQESRLSTRPPSILEMNGKDISATVKMEEPVKGKLVEDETSAIGKVTWSVYDTYFKNASYKAVFGMAASYALFNAFNVAGSFWLTAWTGDAEDPRLRNSTEQRDFRVGIYGMFGGIQGGKNSAIHCALKHFRSNFDSVVGIR